MSLYSKPGWYVDVKLARPTGKYSIGAFLHLSIGKPRGSYNPGAFQDGQVHDPTRGQGVRKYSPGGGYQDPQKPQKEGYSGKVEAPKHSTATRPYTPGGFQDNSNPLDPDPYGNYYFALSITDEGGSPTEVAHFNECSGLKNSCQVFEWEEGGMNFRSHKRPGQSKWENIVLRYATSSSLFLLGWRDKWLQDKFDLRQKYSGAITLKNNKGDTVRTYEFSNAWPVSWEGPTLNSGGSELAVETLELAHDGLKIVQPS